MELHALGISYKHDRDFRIERPTGSGDNLLLIFKTAANVRLGNETILVKPDSAVIYSKNSPQIYGAADGGYVNHFVHFDCSETDIFFDRTGVRFNVPFAVSDIAAAENVLKMLSLESVTENGSGECSDLLLRLLIAKMWGDGSKNDLSVHSTALRQLRAEIYSTPSGRFTVESMAEKLSLSMSHFQSLYRSEFGVSCYEDVLRAKLSSAKYYLSNTNLSVKDISELCGFDNDVHFIRQFKRRTGMTALQYRAAYASSGKHPESAREAFE